MLKKVLLAVAALVVVFVAVVASQPSSYHVERSIDIKAPVDVVYAQVADFHAWQAWSPWEHLDPAMQKTFDGTTGAAGSSYAWKGNKDVGSGKMTVLEALAPTSLTVRLEFIEPFASVATNGFKLAPAGDAVKTTWWMDGENDFMGKAFCLFMDMDKMIGGDFEKGLAALKKVAEAEAAKRAAAARAQVAVPQPAEAPAAAPEAAPRPGVPVPGPNIPPPVAP